MTALEILAPFEIHPETPSIGFFGCEDTRFYSFGSEVEMKEAFAQIVVLHPSPLVGEDGSVAEPEFTWPGVGALKVIGALYNDDAVIEDDVEISPATAKPGWHVNLLPAEE